MFMVRQRACSISIRISSLTAKTAKTTLVLTSLPLSFDRYHVRSIKGLKRKTVYYPPLSPGFPSYSLPTGQMSSEQSKRKRDQADPSSRPDSVKQRRVSATPDSPADQRGEKSNKTNKDPSLSSWLNLPPPPPLPEPFFTAPPVFDRDSIFIGYALPLSEPSSTIVKDYIARLPHDHPNLPDVVAGRSGIKGDVGGSDPKTKARAKIKPSHNMWAYKVGAYPWTRQRVTHDNLF